MSNKLWAIADIHLSFKSNKEEWERLQPKGADDGLILAGDGARPSPPHPPSSVWLS